VTETIQGLAERCRAFAAGPGAGSVETDVSFSVEARYLGQAWDIQVPLPASPHFDPASVEALIRQFHAVHQELFAVADPASAIEFLTWCARVQCRLSEASHAAPSLRFDEQREPSRRRAFFSGHGWLETAVRDFASLTEPLSGPAIIESPFTTVVLPPGASGHTSPNGSLVIASRI
jgi:N-methylhydantoinase A